MQAHAQNSSRSSRGRRPLALTAAAALLVSLAACTGTNTSEPAAQTGASAPAASTGGDVVLWADAGLMPLLQPLLAEFEASQQRRVQVRWGDSAEMRRLLGTGAGQVDVFLGLNVPLPDNQVLVVHPGQTPAPTLGLPASWGTPQWLWRDRLCTLSRVPVTPGTVMGQWQRKGVVLAADRAGAEQVNTPLSQPVARVLVQAEGLQPGLRATLVQKVRQWQHQSPAVDAIEGVLKNTAHMAIAPCAQVQALGQLPAPVQSTRLSPALDVPLDYGVAVRSGSSEVARQLAQVLHGAAAMARAQQLGLESLR